MAYKKDKKDYKQEMKDITDRLETGIKELFESEKYKNYLQTMAKFHNYSVNNTVLIHMQMPHSQRVASYKAWKEKFNRQVKKGEKAIRIFAPIQVKSNMNIEVDKIDPVTKRPVVDENGEIVTEIKNVKELRFKLVPVFDVSQTEGEPLPTIAENLIGNVENYETFIDALKSVSPFPITFEKLPESTDGQCIFGNENRIEIREGMSEIQTVSAVIHEIAHSILHKKEDTKLEKPDNKTKKTEEVEAESVSYVVCQHFGIETSANSFGYITSWSSGKELKELKDSLETIRNTSANIINSVEEYLAEVQKNRENQKEVESENEIETTFDPALEPTVTIIWSENENFHDGETMSLFQANILMEKLDEENLERPGYDKTEFQINFIMNGEFQEYKGRQDLGDGDGSLIEHIETFYSYYENNEEWDNRILLNEGEEVLKAEKAEISFMLNEFVPYLKLHCNLSEIEQTAKTALQKNENMTSAEIDYHTATQEYVLKCREKINQGDYSLPPIPQLEDFNTEFQEYKEQVKEEITQEAAGVGMIVEEYAANGYEPYTAQEKSDIENPVLETTPLTQIKESENFSSKPTLREIYDNYFEKITERILEDTAYKNACTTAVKFKSLYDEENVKLECRSAVQRAIKYWIDNPLDNKEFIQVCDLPEFIDRLCKESFEVTFLNNKDYFVQKESEIAVNSEKSDEMTVTTKNQIYIMPDKDITIDERNEFGYDYENMLPLTQNRALELFDSDNVIYTLYYDNTEGMVFERDEILNAKGVIFGIEKEDWEMSEEYKHLKIQLENETPSENKDKYLIYQLKDGEELHSYRFVSFEELKKDDLKIDVNNYEFVYSGDLKENDTLNTIYNEFNIAHPDDFRGHSLSVSDVVVIEKDNEISSYYVDRIGFKELPVFLGNETFPSKKEIEIDSACISNYKGMTAFVGSDDYVYLGKSENYHYGEICYYDNSDKSMMFMSDNKEIYYFLYNDSWNISQQEMLDSGYYKKEVYEEFDRLQKTVLKDLPYKDGFDGIKFDGEPFVPPDKLIIREETKIDDKSEEVSETVSIQNNNDLIGKTVIINDRQFLIDNISEISGRVSMIDLTFQQRAGFPITREESIDYVRKFLKQEKEKPISEKNNSEILDKSVNADKKFYNENKKPKRNSILETIKENKKEISSKVKENKEIKKQDRRIL